MCFPPFMLRCSFVIPCEFPDIPISEHWMSGCSRMPCVIYAYITQQARDGLWEPVFAFFVIIADGLGYCLIRCRADRTTFNSWTHKSKMDQSPLAGDYQNSSLDSVFWASTMYLRLVGLLQLERGPHCHVEFGHSHVIIRPAACTSHRPS